MSDRMRWRYGDTNPVVAAVDSATVIEIGDLLWQNVDDAKPASVLLSGPSTSLQEVFADNFLGVALQRSKRDDASPIRAATTGVFEFELDCVPSTFELGDLIGVGSILLKGDDGLPVTELRNQQVSKAEESKRAIARIARREPIATGSVLVDIRSTVMTGGIIQR